MKASLADISDQWKINEIPILIVGFTHIMQFCCWIEFKFEGRIRAPDGVAVTSSHFMCTCIDIYLNANARTIAASCYRRNSEEKDRKSYLNFWNN